MDPHVTLHDLHKRDDWSFYYSHRILVAKHPESFPLYLFTQYLDHCAQINLDQQISQLYHSPHTAAIFRDQLPHMINSILVHEGLSSYRQKY